MSKLQFPRVLRGGSYYGVTPNLRTSGRLRHEPEGQDWYYGFRLNSERRDRRIGLRIAIRFWTAPEYRGRSNGFRLVIKRRQKQ